MKIRPGLLLLLLCIFPAIRLLAQDHIHKTDSTVIDAKVLEINESEIKYKKFSNPDGPAYSILKSQVAYIVYQNGEKEIYSKQAPAAIPSAPFDTLVYLEKELGFTLQAVTTPDTGCKIVSIEHLDRIKAPGLKPPLNDVLKYVGASSTKEEIRSQGKRIRTTTDFTRAIVTLKQQGAQTAYCLVRFNKQVDHVYAVDISTLTFTPVTTTLTPTQPQPAAGTGKSKVKPPCAYKKMHLQVEAGIAFRNQYLIGDLNTWFLDLNQSPDGGVSDGTSSFYYASFGAVFPVNKKKARPICIGTSVFADFPHGNALAWPIQGRVVTYASSSPVNYIRLKPLMLGISIPVRFPISDYSAISFTPSFIYGRLTGYSYGSQDETWTYNRGSDGMGMTCTLGLEFFFGAKKKMGVTMNTGYRLLETKLNYSDGTSDYSPVLHSYGSPVRVDLSGGFLLLGFAIRTNK